MNQWALEKLMYEYSVNPCEDPEKNPGGGGGKFKKFEICRGGS